MAKVILVTTKTCVYCPTAKKIWQEIRQSRNFDYQEVDAGTPDGQKIAQKFGVMSVPTTIINGRVEFVGVPDKARAILRLDGKD